MKKINMDEAQAIAKEWFKANYDLDSLGDTKRRQITMGYTAEGDLGITSFYIPGDVPQDGEMLGEVRVNLVTQEVKGKIA